MDFFARRNLAILGLAQVGVLVAGVLLAGAAHKWYAQTIGLAPSRACQRLCEYGWLGLTLPLAWIATVVGLAARERTSDEAKAVAVLAGVLLLVLFLGVAWIGAAQPLLHLMVGCGFTLAA